MNKRIYEDYLKKSRLTDYRDMLLYAREKGYKLIGIRDFYKLAVIDGVLDEEDRYLISRHDVDTSPKIAGKLFKIENEVYGGEGSSTFYFRKSTVDVRLMREIEQAGFESGYHYEELASYEKKKKYKNTDKLLEDIDIIRDEFADNLKRLRDLTGLPIDTVASHGDFVNRRLKMSNSVILENAWDLRKELGILLEAYDDSISVYVTSRLADQKLYENFCKEVRNSVDRDDRIIMMLTHPRQWETDIKANTADNINRIYEGLKYR